MQLNRRQRRQQRQKDVAGRVPVDSGIPSQSMTHVGDFSCSSKILCFLMFPSGLLRFMPLHCAMWMRRQVRMIVSNSWSLKRPQRGRPDRDKACPLALTSYICVMKRACTFLAIFLAIACDLQCVDLQFPTLALGSPAPDFELL